jgi:hypothetical protein
LPWWLGVGGVMTIKNKIRWSRCGNLFFAIKLFFPPDPVDSPLLNFFLNALGGQGGPAGQARAQRAEQGGGARYRTLRIYSKPGGGPTAL